MLEQKSFRRYHLVQDDKRETFTVSINAYERSLLDKCKVILEQKKDSTALKQLAWIGAKVLHDEKTAYVLASIFKNKRNNRRSGIVEFDV